MSKANDKQIGGRHYKNRKVQHWDYACQLPYLEGLATKYIDRHREKGGKEDLLKAIHTIEKMIEEYYPANEPTPMEVSPGMGMTEPSITDPDVCPHDSGGKHRWSHIYKNGPHMRMVDTLVCDICHKERENV